MAFPGTYNISYYKGDTLEFVVYPKNSNGQAFDLTGYSAEFTIANAKGTSGTTRFLGRVDTQIDPSLLRCVITPTVGQQLEAGVTYVYDIEIKNEDPLLTYPIVHTILQGSISVTDQVTGAL